MSREPVPGRRVYPNADGHLLLAEGDYGIDRDGLWLLRPPGSGAGALDGHTVEEHEDGTITVSPSLDGPGFHGYLRRGVWSWC